MADPFIRTLHNTDVEEGKMGSGSYSRHVHLLGYN